MHQINGMFPKRYFIKIGSLNLGNWIKIGYYDFKQASLVNSIDMKSDFNRENNLKILISKINSLVMLMTKIHEQEVWKIRQKFLHKL